MIGMAVGNHRIVEKLGDGGMGTVYRAIDQMLDRDVAIKVLRPELTRDTSLTERFRAEAIAMARVSHPNIAMLHGLERHGDELFMIMEYVRGETLEHIVQRTGKLDWRRAAEILTSVLDALGHAHHMGVVHRDIKPANIMITHTGAVKVMDFGIARMVGRSRQTQLGHAVGTPSYMAPEQLRGEDVDGRTDLYAVGAALFELVTGRTVFEADSDYRLMMMQLHDPPPAPSSIQRDVPAAIDRIVLRAMEKKAEDRFPSAAAFRTALQDALQQTPVSHPGPTAGVPTRRGDTRPLPTADAHRTPALGSAAARTSRLARLAPNTPERPRGWRPWVVAASGFVTAAVLALALKPSAGQVEQSAADSSAVGPNVDTALASAKANPEMDTAAASGVVLPPPVATPREAREADSQPVSLTPPAQPEESAESVRASIIAGISTFAGAVNSGAVAEVERLLRGPERPRAMLLGLVRAKGLTMIPQASTAPEIRGSDASVPFGARLSWRTRTGSVRRTTMPMQAEFSRSGNAWQLNSVRIMRPVDLR